MKERPILFNGEMVRAILAGKKTQTRRVVDLRNSDIDSKFFTAADFSKAWADPSFPNDQYLHVPAKGGYADFDGEIHRVRCKTQSGDHLWVRETFRIYDSHSECACYINCICSRYHGKPVYRADQDFGGNEKWTPSIHMKYGQHRLTLEVTAVRVERLCSISEADARAEGLPEYLGKRYMADLPSRHRFRALWCSIYGDASWDANPWVWVYEFKIAERKDGK